MAVPIFYTFDINVGEPRVPKPAYGVERDFVLSLQRGRINKEFGCQYAASCRQIMSVEIFQ